MKFNPQMLQIYLVGGTQDTHHDSYEFLDKVEEAMQAGITAFQYREKDSSTMTADARLIMARRLVEMGKRYSIPIFIDDDVEMALRVGADGVHVGQDDEQIHQVIEKANGKLMIGYSCNTPAEIKAANQIPEVDYIGCGPVFETTSKQDADPALGLTQLQNLTELSTHPLVAIGGINLDNMAAVLKTGVSGLSIISMVLDSQDITSTIQQIKQLY
ncbi:thiamine phosphate synthase [Limosilactobacillus fastidiosus]|uniref:Thiamine-phosphate synthase n=1 Tax=Limosilactobacillus fastidiosus TaxID=2759855 RepID=A0A7W3YCA6_9LACO|nr:thiamine phosphate synthase [Limosilactobacillus fastidiosus]MBB1062716.1 thiamine phosphate synthase [Limosilactobacillus fastidiosus]MBB1086549.1 thiamine phosphate synthase [Limosilactobacillus fastidiosus]MCD7084871.1 thiamine phosphate synthase [Limosilactobacillus fastidiosus]MCD7085308.1 thiamine phosphate synthase [Limosilactobacillus fastidiosus]MCD7115137.1 thiamine phosphate synthase [Limosilactobacillus fastidiosus]